MFYFTESSKEQSQNWSLMIWECAGRVWKDNFCSGGSKRLFNVFLFAFVVTNALRKGEEGFVKLAGRKNLFSHASFVINALRELKTSEKPLLTLNNRALFHHLCFILLIVAKKSHGIGLWWFGSVLAEFEKTTFAVEGQRGFLTSFYLLLLLQTHNARGFVKLAGRKNIFSHASFVINALRKLKTSEILL